MGVSNRRCMYHRFGGRSRCAWQSRGGSPLPSRPRSGRGSCACGRRRLRTCGDRGEECTRARKPRSAACAARWRRSGRRANWPHLPSTMALNIQAIHIVSDDGMGCVVCGSCTITCLQKFVPGVGGCAVWGGVAVPIAAHTTGRGGYTFVNTL